MIERPTSRLPLLLAAPIGALALIGGVAGACAPHFFHSLTKAHPAFAKPFATGAVPLTIYVLAWILSGAGLAGVAAAAAALLRRPAGRAALTIAVCCVYIQSGAWIYVVLNALGALLDANAEIGGVVPDADQASHLRLLWVAPALVAGLLAVALHLLSTRRRVSAAYGLVQEPASPDETIGAAEVARRLVRPRDPTSRSSIDFSLALHFLIVAILPIALVMHGCSDSYLIPGGGGGGGGGGGDGAVGKGTTVVKLMKQPKRQPSRRKKHFGRSNSAISLAFPSIDDSTVAADVAEVTENIYTANVNDVDIATDAGGFAGEGGGGFGHGPGSGGGFGGGSSQGIIRFIRLQYEDPQWNDGMDTDSRADMNFLDELHKVSHLKTADHSEAIPVSALRNFKKGQAPPFVYFTGTAGVINLNAEDARVLRQYLLDGGMLFADAGSEEWGRAFRSFIARVFPERELLDISNDDPIFQQPFRFPNGAPPLWHHDGSRARGLKIDGRWAVFYFPGNLNDAWKTGHGGQSPAIVTQSMRLGMNIVWYSFVHYLEVTKRK